MAGQVVYDARCLGTDHARRGIGRVATELLAALDAFAPHHVRVIGPAWLRTHLRNLPVEEAPARLVRSVLPPGDLRPDGLLVRLAPTMPGPLDDRSLVVCHDLIPLKALDVHFPWKRRVRRPLSRSVYLRSLETLRRARAVVTTTAAVADDVARRLGVPRERLHTIGLAASTPFHRRPHAAAPVPDLVGSDYVLWILGGLNENKNPLGLLRAYAHGPLPPLVLTGHMPPALVARLQGHARRLGSPEPRFVGAHSDKALARLMRDAVCTVVPSLDEGYGLPVAEALAAGGRVVANDHPAMRAAGDPEVRYVDARDPAALYAALASADELEPARGPRRRWTDVAREHLALARDLVR
jgi:hypothetical protein